MKNKKFWQFKNQANNVGELLIYGPISSYTWWGDEVTPKQFKQELSAMGNAEKINVCINSDGGDTFAAQAIFSMLKRHDAEINVYIDGMAASAASIIAMAGDTIFMPANAMMMVHNPWTIARGNSEDFRKLADDLDKVREAIVAAYAEKTGRNEDKIIELLDAETYMTAEEAVELGFADQIEAEKQIAASLDAGILTVNGLKMEFVSGKGLERFAEKKSKPEPEEPQPMKPLPADLSALDYLEASVAARKQRY